MAGWNSGLTVPHYQVSCLSLLFLQVSSVSPQDRHAGPCALRAGVKALHLVTPRTPWNQEQNTTSRTTGAKWVRGGK